jgi:hypothetical protein
MDTKGIGDNLASGPTVNPVSACPHRSPRHDVRGADNAEDRREPAPKGGVSFQKVMRFKATSPALRHIREPPASFRHL